jgi:hypothetical protein
MAQAPGKLEIFLHAYVKVKAWGAAGTQNSLSSLTPSNLSLGRLFWEPTDTKIVSDLMSTRAEIDFRIGDWDLSLSPT